MPVQAWSWLAVALGLGLVATVMVRRRVRLSLEIHPATQQRYDSVSAAHGRQIIVHNIRPAPPAGGWVTLTTVPDGPWQVGVRVSGNDWTLMSRTAHGLVGVRTFGAGAWNRL